MRKGMVTLTLVVMLAGAALTAAQDATPPQDGVSVTVYNQGTALVQDRRTFELEAGINLLDFTDVAGLIDPTSVSFSSLTDPDGTVVLEQNYVYDLVNSEALLARYLDETIEVTTTLDGTTFRGQLLSGRGGEIILRTDSGEVVVVRLANVRDIRFPALPDGLITRPTLRWMLSSAQSGPQQVELTYLTGGMSWSADYIVLLARDNRSLDLNGWVTLVNNSGTTYRDALLKLVAGDLSRLPSPDDMRMEVMAMDAMGGAPAPAVSQREFFEYQLYAINRPVTIASNETKQIEFVSGAGVPATTFFVYDGGPAFYGYYSPIIDRNPYSYYNVTSIQSWLEFSTDAEGGLGADLPAGRIRVYQEDIDGAALLIGENQIGHTPEGEFVRFYLGDAFDLVGERTQTDFTILSRTVVEETFEIRLRNRKDSDTVVIRVPERLYRWSNWTILSNSHDYTRLNSSTIEFRVEVPPGEEVVISYTVRYSWSD